jgi:c-di-GMP-related signal transduction protein
MGSTPKKTASAKKLSKAEQEVQDMLNGMDQDFLKKMTKEKEQRVRQLTVEKDKLPNAVVKAKKRLAKLESLSKKYENAVPEEPKRFAQKTEYIRLIEKQNTIIFDLLQEYQKLKYQLESPSMV